MLFFQDDKDKLKQELESMNREIQASKNALRYHWDLIKELKDEMNGITNIYPHGAKKDGTPRAKPGRKPRELTALEELRNLSVELASDPNKRADFLRMAKKLKPEMPAGFEELK